MRVLDLFSGIGGFSLGLERAGFETVAFCEIEEFPQKILAKRWPNVPIYHDIKTLTKEVLDADKITVDVICGGFPCQPFSTASHGVKTATDLWPEMLRIITEARPTYAIAENVTEKAIDIAKKKLENEGFYCVKKNISAAQIGADHLRSRWWLIAHTNDQGKLSCAIDAEVAVMQKLCDGFWGAENYTRAIRVPNGFSDRSHRLKALGNAVVPQIPELIGKAIMAYESNNEKH